MRTLILLYFISCTSLILSAQDFHELKTGIVTLIRLDPNLSYERSKDNIGFEVTASLGNERLSIFNNLGGITSFESFRRPYFGTEILIKHYLHPLSKDHPFVTYFGGQSRIRVETKRNEDYIVRYREQIGREPELDNIMLWSLEFVGGVKSIIKQSRFTLDGKFYLGLDSFELVKYGDFSFTAGINLKLGYILNS